MHQKSLSSNYVDLNPNDFNDHTYYIKRGCGDIPITVDHVATDLIEWGYPLTKT